MSQTELASAIQGKACTGSDPIVRQPVMSPADFEWFTEVADRAETDDRDQE